MRACGKTGFGTGRSYCRICHLGVRKCSNLVRNIAVSTTGTRVGSESCRCTGRIGYYRLVIMSECFTASLATEITELSLITSSGSPIVLTRNHDKLATKADSYIRQNIGDLQSINGIAVFNYGFTNRLSAAYSKLISGVQLSSEGNVSTLLCLDLSL